MFTNCCEVFTFVMSITLEALTKVTDSWGCVNIVKASEAVTSQPDSVNEI